MKANALYSPGKNVVLSEEQGCQIPGCDHKARYDAKTKNGPWAYLCSTHFTRLGVGLGTGKGQMITYVEEGR